jgi:hypothetical protein
MRHMPPAFRKQRSGYWPPILRSFWEAYGNEASKDTLRIRITPTPRQISEMDEVIG